MRVNEQRSIWWIWEAFFADIDDRIHVLDVLDLWNCEDDYEEYSDVAWLGEGAWIGLTDNMKMGLKSV